MNKKNLFLLGVLIILGIFSYLSITKPWKKQESPLVFPGLSQEEITKIEIKSFQESTILKKNNNSWIITTDGNLLADEKKVNSFLDKLKKLKKINLASTNPQKASFYEVGGVKGVKVRLWDKDKLMVQFVVGKNGPSFVGSYLKEENSSSIYLVDEVIRNYLDKNNFKDRRVLNIPQDKIVGLAWEYPENSFQILKNDEAWRLGEKGKKVDIKKVKEITGFFANFLAKDVFSASQKKIDWEKTDLTLIIKKEDGEDKVKIIIQGQDNNKQYFAQLNDREVIYELYDYQAKKLFKKRKDF